jgi:hypothetical protein
MVNSDLGSTPTIPEAPRLTHPALSRAHHADASSLIRRLPQLDICGHSPMRSSHTACRSCLHPIANALVQCRHANTGSFSAKLFSAMATPGTCWEHLQGLTVGNTQDALIETPGQHNAKLNVMHLCNKCADRLMQSTDCDMQQTPWLVFQSEPSLRAAQYPCCMTY